VSRWCGFLIKVLEVAVRCALVESVLLNVAPRWRSDLPRAADASCGTCAPTAGSRSSDCTAAPPP
jgi:hypothetical protein